MNKEAELKKHRCCFTGHRPEKLQICEDELKAILQAEIQNAIADGFSTFISGMAKGVDIVAAELVLQERKNNPKIHLICALPFSSFGENWSRDWVSRRNAVLSEADFVRSICNGFSYASYQQRNKWMVDHSACVIAIYNGSNGGTKNTIEYAKQEGISVMIKNG